MDHELNCVLRNPSADAIQKFENRMSLQGDEWTVSMAETLLSSIQKRPNLVPLLARAEMDDHVLYAVQQYLPDLTELVLEQHGNDAIVAVVRMWEALERMRSFSSTLVVDTLWIFSHVESEKLNAMAHVAVDIITSPSNIAPTSGGLPAMDPDTVCNASVTFLSLLLQHDVKDWLLDLEDTSRLVHRLEHEMNRLKNSVISSPASVGLALSCVGLLCLVSWKTGDELPDYASLMDSVCKVAFPSSSNSPSGPQWTYGPVATDVRPCALALLQIWSLIGDTLPDRCVTHFLNDSWARVLETRGGECLPSLLFLHTTNRLSTRQSLHFVLGRKDFKESCRTFVASLMHHSQQKDIALATSSAALLRTLLSDRKSTITNDDLSRTMWAAMEVFPIDKLLEGIVKLACSNPTSRRTCQPLLVGMMDVLELLASYPEGNRLSILESFTERIESLIEIMASRPDSNNDLSLSMEEMNDHTPTANNLSRLDESHISFMAEPVDESTKPPTELDDSIRIAVATCLFHISEAGGTSTLSENTTCVWRARIRTSVMDFVSSIRFHGHLKASADMKRRLFRLQALLATFSTENEGIISSLLVDEELLCRREQNDQDNKLRDCQRQLEEALTKVKQLEAERDKCKKAMRLQSTTFDRDVQRYKSKATAEATQLVEVHAAERRAAENRAEACARRAKHVEELQREADSRIEEYKALEAQARQELNEIDIKLEATRDELRKEREFNDEQKRRCSDQLEELSNCKERLELVEGLHQSTRSHLTENQTALDVTKKEYSKLHANLEETFAQLSLLAQAYQTKEDEITRIVEKKDRAIQEARRSADAELQRNDDLEANQRTLQYENERITKKLQRAKEKLEEERNQRHEESQQRKRSGPVSYVNSLHTSTTDPSNRSRHRSRSNTSRQERRRGTEKENGGYRREHSSRSLSSQSSLRREYR